MVKFDSKEGITFDCVNVFDFWLVGFALIEIKKSLKISILAELRKTSKTTYIIIFALLPSS